MNAETVARIAKKEKVDGILSGMGGQTALNICSELAENGTLDQLGIKLLGTQPRAIALSEDRELFREMMIQIGEPIPKSKTVHSIDEVKQAARELGKYPVLVVPHIPWAVPGRHRQQRRRAGDDHGTRIDIFQDPPGIDRRERARMEGVRVRSDARFSR